MRKVRLQVTIEPEVRLVLEQIAEELDVPISQVLSIIIRGQWSRLPEALSWWYGVSASQRVKMLLERCEVHAKVAETNRVK